MRKRTRIRSCIWTELESDLIESFSMSERSEGAAREISEIPAARFCSITVSDGSGGNLFGFRGVDFLDLDLDLLLSLDDSEFRAPEDEDALVGEVGGERRKRCWIGGRVRSSCG